MSASLVSIEPVDDGVDLVLVRGRGNAFTTDGLTELEAAFASLLRAGAPPVVLRSSGRSFCTGLDLEFCLGLDRTEMEALMVAFHRALVACIAYPGPVVAAIGGPALAGGALLALCCDLRLGASGHARFGVHGVRLGVSYPQVAVEIARAQLGETGAARLLYEGHLLDAAEAHRTGWIDTLVAADRLVATARIEAHERAGPTAKVHAASKLRLRAAWLARLRTIDRAGMDAWLDQWFSPQTRARVESSRHERGERSAALDPRRTFPGGRP